MNEQDEREIEAFYAGGSAFSRLYESAGRGICPPELEEELRSTIRQASADTTPRGWFGRLRPARRGGRREQFAHAAPQGRRGPLLFAPRLVPVAGVCLMLIGVAAYFAFTGDDPGDGAPMVSNESPMHFQGAPMELTGLKDSASRSEEQPSAAALLERIEALRRQGKREEADRALQQLRALYPEQAPASQ